MKFIFTCGGTAGHVNPALAVAGRLRELMPGCEILFIGANGQMETDLVPRAGYEIKTVTISSIARGKSIKSVMHNTQTAYNVLNAAENSMKIIRSFKPDAVIGTGGYVCYPVLLAASRMGIPTLVHESNAVPGLTTKLLADRIDRVMVGFEESRQYYKNPEKVVVTGTPVRGEFGAYTKENARRELGMDEKTPLVVSVWGSLGAQHMNERMMELIPMIKGDEGFKLLHVTGRLYRQRVMDSLAANAPDHAERNVEVREYIYDMPRIMAAADLIMCRAGASTLAELAYMGRPAILVPSPNVTNHHQERNARVLEKAGGAKVLLEGEFNSAQLFETIKTLLSDKESLNNMGSAMRSLSVDDATDKICSTILELIK